MKDMHHFISSHFSEHTKFSASSISMLIACSSCARSPITSGIRATAATLIVFARLFLTLLDFLILNKLIDHPYCNYYICVPIPLNGATMKASNIACEAHSKFDDTVSP